MKWFKHMTDMSQDVKIKRVIRKHGVEGYGLYCYILELVVRKIETESPLPDLEETSNDIAADLNMDTIKVEDIMLYCIEQGLFEQDEVTGKLCANKVYKFLQQSETRSRQIREMIAQYKDKKSRPGLSETNVKTRTEQTRTEQTRTEENTDSLSAKNQETDRNYSRELETLKEYWNSQGLPEFRKSLMNISNIQEIMDVLRVYSFEEAKKAIENYVDIKQTRERAIVYSTFPNFIERGVEKYADSSKPYENIGRDRYTGPAVDSAPAESTQEEIDQIWGL